MHPERIRALCSSSAPLAETVWLVKEAMRADPLLDLQIAELILGRTTERPLGRHGTVRALEILDRVTVGTRLVRVIRELLIDDDPLVRSKAAMLIGRRIEGLNWVYSHLENEEPRVRANIIEALWDSRNPESAMIFEHYCADPDSRVAANSLYGMYLRAPAEATPAIRYMASHQDPKVRAAAAWLMGKTGETGFLELLKNMTRDLDRRVRGAALKALVRINRARG